MSKFGLFKKTKSPPKRSSTLYKQPSIADSIEQKEESIKATSPKKSKAPTTRTRTILGTPQNNSQREQDAISSRSFEESDYSD